MSTRMIILYIPFIRKKSGDLSSLVQLWKQNHQRTSSEPIVIIYQNEDFDHDAIAPHSSLYICAHGYGTERLEVGNNAQLKKALRISIPTLANRVNSDFLPIAYKLAQIHMYCCGSESKNSNITRHLKQNLLRPESTMVFYSGTLTIADRNGIKWSLGQGKKVPVEATAVHTFFVYREENEEVINRRVPIKQLHRELWLEEARMARHSLFFEHQRQHREACLNKRRKGCETAVIPKLT